MQLFFYCTSIDMTIIIPYDLYILYIMVIDFFTLMYYN
jgi:hypothetical protein